MSDDERLEAYLKLCLRMYERMKREGSFPWRDSTKAKDAVDSADV